MARIKRGTIQKAATNFEELIGHTLEHGKEVFVNLFDTGGLSRGWSSAISGLIKLFRCS